MIRIGADRQAVLPFRVLGDAVAHFPRQVQAAPVVFEDVDDAQALEVVLEAAGHERVQHALAGVAERRVSEIVAERDRFGQLLVQAQHFRDGARDLRDLERVRQARPVVIAGRREEHLRLVLQPAEGLAVDDAVAVALKRGTDGILGLRTHAPAAVGALRPPAARAISRSRLSRSSRMAVATTLIDQYRSVPAARAVQRQAGHRSARKLVPCASSPTPKMSASVWPRSANVARSPRSTPARTPAPDNQHGHVLARMIGARRRRIVAVIGGDDEQIRRPQVRQQRGEPRVEALEIARVAGDVVAMPVERVEVDEVREDQPGRVRFDRALDRVDALVIVRGVDSPT